MDGFGKPPEILPRLAILAGPIGEAQKFGLGARSGRHRDSGSRGQGRRCPGNQGPCGSGEEAWKFAINLLPIFPLIFHPCPLLEAATIRGAVGPSLDKALRSFLLDNISNISDVFTLFL